MNDITPYQNENEKQNYLIEANLNNLSRYTLQAYKKDFNNFLNIVNKPVHGIVEKDIINYIRFLEDRRYKNSTINRKIYSISKIFQILHQNLIINNNPIEKLKNTTKLNHHVNKSKKYLPVSLEDIEKVINRSDLTTSLIVLFLINTGVRISECLNILNEDVKKSNNHYEIYIKGKGKKERTIFIDKDIYQKIKDYFDKDSNYLFHNGRGNRIDRNNIYRKIRKSFLEFTGADIHPHIFRHFWITYQVSVKKADITAVSRYAGHSSVSFTLETYNHNVMKPEEARIL